MEAVWARCIAAVLIVATLSMTTCKMTVTYIEARYQKTTEAKP